jgi:nickel-type superoxide dismutase maturation protease
MSRTPRSRWAITGALVGAAGLALAWPGLRRIVRSWGRRVAVEGHSMEPGLEPGDWVLVDPEAYAARPPRPGELVLAPDPREDDRLLIKRVAGVDADGGLRLAGDNGASSTDWRTFGSVDARRVEGRPWLRYWPPMRAGILR